jgi:hypothetical protein
MADPFYSWHVGELRTGRITAEVPVSEASWQTVIDDAGALSFTTVLTDSTVRLLDLYTSAEPCRCFLAVAYTDATGTETFLEAGPVWTHSYDSADSRLTVAGTGVWALFDHRKILPVLAPGVSPASQTVSFASKSLGAVARGLVELAMTHVGGDLPLVLPADEAGTWSLSYSGFDLAVLGQALRDLAAADGGPEIQFVPRRREDDRRYLEWEMLVGSAAQPLLTQDGEDLVFDQSARRSQVTGLTVNRDGSKMVDRWWTQGAGTDVSTKFGRADDATGLIAAGFPLLEDSDQQSDVTDQAILDGGAAAALTANRSPILTYGLTVHRDGIQADEGSGVWRGHSVVDCRVGSWAAVTVGGQLRNALGTVVGPKEPYLAPAGDTRDIRARITSVSGDLTPSISLGLAPEVEAA